MGRRPSDPAAKGAGETGPISAPRAALSLPQVEVYPDGDCLCLAVAGLFSENARRAAEARGRFLVALAGGSTPRRAYELLARKPFTDLVPWEAVHVFWGDERCVDLGDPRSNERMAREALLEHVPIPPEQLHPMRCLSAEEAEDPASSRTAEAMARRAAGDYERLLRAVLGDSDSAQDRARGGQGGGAPVGLDLVLLGLGTDGHTASLFPESDALREERRWVVATIDPAARAAADAAAAGAAERSRVPGTSLATGAAAGASGAADDLWRVTLTAQFINRAAVVVFVVSGKAKAAVVREVIEGPVDPVRLPAQLIRPVSGDLRWFLDDDSASLLSDALKGRARGRPQRPEPAQGGYHEQPRGDRSLARRGSDGDGPV